MLPTNETLRSSSVPVLLIDDEYMRCLINLRFCTRAHFFVTTLVHALLFLVYAPFSLCISFFHNSFVELWNLTSIEKKEIRFPFDNLQDNRPLINSMFISWILMIVFQHLIRERISIVLGILSHCWRSRWTSDNSSNSSSSQWYKR